MFRNTAFSPRDWELAPRYSSPRSRDGFVVLEFERLEEIVAREREIGSFRTDPDGRLAAAPLYVDDMPAAFYDVSTSWPDTTPNINTSRRETLVVMDGALKLVFNDVVLEAEDRPDDLDGVLAEGHVIDLEERAVSLQAVHPIDPAHCLVLALYRDRDIQAMAA